MAVNLRTTHFRFGNDDGNEAGHTFMAAEDTNVSLFAGVNFLLRFCEQETGGTAIANVDAQFQYNLNGAGWVNITTTSAAVKAVAVNAFANGDDCTKRLSGTGTFESSGDGCTEDGNSGGNQNDIAASGNSETECGLQIVAGQVARGDTIQFQLTSPDTTITNDVVPTVTVLANLTLAIASGAFAVTGTAVSLKATRQLAIASGAYVLTGTHVDLTVGGALTHYTLPIASGAYALTGTATALKTARKLAIESGAYVLNGTAIGLMSARKLAIASGTHSLTGTTVNLKVARKLSLASGIYLLTGTATTLKATRNLAISSGEYVLIGDSIGLQVTTASESSNHKLHMLRGSHFVQGFQFWRGQARWRLF